MTWQTHTERGQCASAGCSKLAVWRFEAGGVGSVYCDDCKHAADDHLSDCVDLDEADDEEWALMSCSMGRDGQCGQAGSEWCDFECPVMRSVRAEARRKAK